jgi:hypothetical protein
MSEGVLEQIRKIIQRDVNRRGLDTEPLFNLLTLSATDFIQACENLAQGERKVVGIVTGFFIPDAEAAETDGPIGAVFLARTLSRLGNKVILVTEGSAYQALQIALAECELSQEITLLNLPTPDERGNVRYDPTLNVLYGYPSHLTHLIAIERAGPSHNRETMSQQPFPWWGSPPVEAFLQQVPVEHWDQYHTMRGRIITGRMFPAHRFFEEVSPRQVTTIGIGDGGNEIGMGKIPWEVIARNVPGGGLVACRVPTDYNIVCGVSNWGAYGLAAGMWHRSGRPLDIDLFNADAERELWEKVLRQAVLVDGVTGQQALTVDGLAWEEYIRPLHEIAAILEASSKP